MEEFPSQARYVAQKQLTFYCLTRESLVSFCVSFGDHLKETQWLTGK